MSIPLEITFHQMPPSAAIESRIREKAEKLARFCDRIIGCAVVIEAPHAHHHKGRLHHIRITVHLPGSQITVNMGTANQRIGMPGGERIRPAAITLDALMPGLDGWAVLAALRTDEETADIPVVMVTISDDEQRGYSLGAAEFVSKPVNKNKIQSALKKLV